MADIVCISPVDGREVARKRPATADEIAAAVAAARKAQADWAQVPIAERGRRQGGVYVRIGRGIRPAAGSRVEHAFSNF